MRFPSYVHDLDCGLYDGWSARSAEERHERMQDLVGRVQRVVAEVVAEYRLPLAADTEESLVRKGGCGRKTRRGGVVEKVKWLRVILDAHLNFREHWWHRIGKECSLLGARGGVGNARQGMNPVN